MKLYAFAPVALTAAMLILSACGGGGGGAPSSPAPAPTANPTPAEPVAEAPKQEDPEPAMDAPTQEEGPPAAPVAEQEDPAPELTPAFATTNDVWAASPILAFESARKAVLQTEVFVGATQSSEGRRATAAFSHAADSPVLRVTAPPLSFDTEGVTPNVTGAQRDYAILDVAAERATAARAIVNTDAAEPGYWTSLGYWMALRGKDFISSAPTSPTIDAIEIGAFADGPEFRGPPASLPLTGRSRYKGPAHGVYMAEIGADGNERDGYGLLCCRPAVGFGTQGSTLVGEFSGNATFEIIYSVGGSRIESPTIWGIMFPEFTGVARDGATGEIERYDTPRGLGVGVAFGSAGATLIPGTTTPISRGGNTRIDRYTGKFHSDLIHVYRMRQDPVPDGTGARLDWNSVTQHRGEWGGIVSNKLNADGHPRSIAGTLGVEGRTPGGTQHIFIGAFVAPLADD